ncbi:glycoside hydrolase [Leifsonia sp. Leaf336]|uniref:glycoside hydrolase family 2 protein n=1 Tax=Leifsonia sp. Leaf336 TaxID=1736341 RepID=UPI0006F5E428|nr:glycoside hydrolase family 2 TIM barrel-domain containing protein [Leifsonia sp. Leaf336]KQR50819.1 glycoside hydrolase [Leifsonia sp. Leaf336]
MTADQLPDPLQQDSGYPRPQLVRRQWHDLGGEWEFAFGAGPEQTPEAVGFDRTIVVPYPPESELSGIGETGYHPVVWYRRTFGAAELAEAGLASDRPRLLLHFGAVDFAADVWLNGRYLGRHVGGQTPFHFEVGGIVDAEGTNELVVRAVDDPLDVSIPRGKQDWRESPHSIWYHRTTGIWQPVWLEAVPGLHVESLAWDTAADAGSVDLELVLNARPSGDVWAAVRIEYEGELLAEARYRVLDTTSHLRLALSRQRNGQQYEELLWSPSNPRLLSATVALEGTGAGSGEGGDDAVASYLGLRTVRTDDRCLLLNDRPFYVRAVLSQNYWPQSHLAAPSADALRREVELILELGFNTARVHQKAEDPRFLYWADRLGLLIWAETASAYEFSARSVQLLTEEWMQLVQRDRSHPSIIAWVPLNESWGVQHISHDPRQRAYSRGLTELTRAIDGTRPVISNDGWEHTDSDLITIHDYEGDPEVLARRYGSRAALDELIAGPGPAGRRIQLHDSEPARPVMLTEFGGVSWIDHNVADAWGYSSARDASDFGERVTGLIGAVTDSPVLAGFCYTQLADTGQETNGLLRDDRTPKVPVELLREAIAGR